MGVLVHFASVCVYLQRTSDGYSQSMVIFLCLRLMFFEDVN